MVRVHPKGFLLRSVKKLQARRTDPYTVLRRIGSNAYELNIPRGLGISSVFSFEDLNWYHASDDYPYIILDPSSLPAANPQHVLISLPQPHHRGDICQRRLRIFYMMRSSQQLVEDSIYTWFVGESTSSLIALGCEPRRLHSSTRSCLRLIIDIIHGDACFKAREG